jgi:hypothetical protein
VADVEGVTETPGVAEGVVVGVTDGVGVSVTLIVPAILAWY